MNSGMSTVASGVLGAWRESAPYWEKHREAIRAMFAPMSGAVIAGAAIAEGHVVLDVAAGTGDLSLEIASACGPRGRVVCTDAVREMVKSASRRRHGKERPNLEFSQCLGEALPFRDGTFDAVVSRLGVMFFPDPTVALLEMLRLLKPQGRLSLAVWYGGQFNPFFTVPSQALALYVPMPAADPDAPGAFRFAEPGKLARLLELAGAKKVQERLFEFRIEASVSLREFWTMRREMSETLRERVRHLSPTELAAVELGMQDAVRRFFPNDKMSFPAQSLIVTGVK
jgi:SAM-dependent methyltransferase